MILLDTAVFLWIITGSKRFSRNAEKKYLDKKNEVYLSSVSVWEIIVKYNLSRLPLPSPPKTYIPKQRYIHGIEALSFDEEDALELDALPHIHSDPFDRMLVCQARVKNLILLTPDKFIRKYPVKTSW